MSVLSVVFSGRGLCDEPIPRPEQSYRVWCVTECDLGTSRMRRPWHALGCCTREKATLGWVFLPALLFSSVSIFPLTLHTHLHLHIARSRTNGWSLGTFSAMLWLLYRRLFPPHGPASSLRDAQVCTSQNNLLLPQNQNKIAILAWLTN